MSQLYIFIFCFFSPFHDVNMAIFDIEIDEQTVEITIQFDAADLEYALSSDNGILIQDINDVKKYIEMYLSNHTQWTINNEVVQFSYQDTKKDEDHYSVSFDRFYTRQQIEEISLYNSCLIKNIKSHKNIIHLRQVNRELRGFQMDASREKININIE